jgi:hypothetical protein
MQEIVGVAAGVPYVALPPVGTDGVVFMSPDRTGTHKGLDINIAFVHDPNRCSQVA